MKYDSRFSVPSKEEQFTLTGIVILNKMIEKKRVFSTLLEGDDTHLEEVFSFLSARGVCDIDTENACYIPTQKGERLYKDFLKRYREYISVYDVFCAVDLQEGVFGFDKIFDYNDAVFRDYIHDPRFQDLRVTIAEFKGINPFEIVFISFLIEKRFREPKDLSQILSTRSWQYRCVYGEIFQEIVEICNNAPHVEELGWEDEEGTVSGVAVVEDVIRQGIDLARNISQKRIEFEQEEQERWHDEQRQQREGEPQTTTTTTHYGYDWYDPWYDPYYVSPVWGLTLTALILL